MKNGVKCMGIRVINPADQSISPVIYYSEQENLEEIYHKVKEALAIGHKVIDAQRITKWEFVKTHAYICVQRRSEDGCVKKPYLNLEACIRVYLETSEPHCSGSYKLTPGLLHKMDVSEEEAWQAAIDNSKGLFSTHPMSEMLGFPESDDEMMYVVLAESGIDGAGALLFPEVFRSFCEKYGERECSILPSSTRELILLPGSKAAVVSDTSSLCAMVNSINQEMVDPLIQLEPTVYRYCIETDAVEIAAGER